MKRRMKKKPFIIIGIIIVVIIALIFSIKYIIDTINYRKTYEYKFLQIGYTIEEFNKINNLSIDTKEYLLTIEYDKYIIELLDQKYFLEKNLKNYLTYSKENEKSINDVIAIINVGSNNDWYTNTKKTDISKGNLLLTNKFYSLDNTYNSDNMVRVSSQYSFGYNQMLTSDTFDAFKKMFNDAKKENLNLIINSSYRSFEDQEEIYEEYKIRYGDTGVDKIAARAGFSEHQTGMAIDIQTYGSTGKTFETFDEFKWLSNNAYKYGFILRYPKDKEYLTGYEYESWHYRYVGVDVAKYIYENNITFDEYYAYFIEKD